MVGKGDYWLLFIPWDIFESHRVFWESNFSRLVFFTLVCLFYFLLMFIGILDKFIALGNWRKLLLNGLFSKLNFSGNL